MTKEQLLKLAQATNFTFDGDEPNVESLMAHVQGITGDVVKLTEEKTQLQTKLTDAETEVTNLTGKVTTLEGKVNEGITSLKEETKKFYSLAKGDKASEAILLSFDAMAPEALNVMLGEFKAESEKLHPASCQDCGSSNITRASATGGEGEAQNQNKKPSGIKSNDEAQAEILESKNTGGSLLRKINPTK